MSWWVKEISTITEDQSERLCIIETDTPNDLPNPVRTKPDPDNPGQTITDYTIVRGSEAYCLSNSKFYKLNSQGQWIEQTDGSGGGGGTSSADQVSYDNTDSGLTATNVQDAIDELHTTDDTQDNALTELYGMDANQQLEIDYAINTGVKNLFPNTAVSQTIGGVTFTVNDDGTVTVNGTKTNNDWFILSENNSFDAGTYTLSDGLPNDTTNCQLIIATARSMSAAIMATSVNSRPQTKTFTTEQTGLYYAIRIASGTTVNNLTFKPMIRRAEITDSTFEPYAPTNRKLYEISETKADKGTFDLTIAGSPLVASEYSYSCIVTGDIVTICVRIILAEELAVNTSRNLFFIPSPYYPPVPCAGAGYADGKVRTFWVNQYGTIKIRIDEAIPAGSNINANFCYSYKTGNWTTVTANQLQSLNSPLTLNLGRNDLNESLDSNFDLIDSIPEEEEGEIE